MTSAHVVVVGAINVDLVITAPRLPGPGETVVGPGVQRHGGGKGANAAVAAARAGAMVHLIGAVGADDTGSGALDELRIEGVDVSEVQVLAGEVTGVAFIVVDPHGENQIAVGAGANAAVTADHVRGALGRVLATAGCVLVSTEIPGDAVAAAVRYAVDAGVPCVLNPAPVIDAVFASLELGPIVTPNSGELGDLAGAVAAAGSRPRSPNGSLGRSVSESARAVLAVTGAPVVVTLGGDGVLMIVADGIESHVPAPAAAVRDTTGAGDTFNGVLATRLASGDPLSLAVRTAVTAASLSVAHIGARSGMPDAAAIAAAQAGAE